jgi:hypothetical protein
LSRPRIPAKYPVLMAALAAACIDMSPLAPAGDADAAPADAPAGDGRTFAVCRRCIADEGAPCWAEYEPCLTTPNCPALVDCFIDTGCYSLPQFEQRVDCAIPCLAKHGVKAGGDPALAIGLRINACTLAACRDDCVME